MPKGVMPTRTRPNVTVVPLKIEEGSKGTSRSKSKGKLKLVSPFAKNMSESVGQPVHKENSPPMPTF